MDGDIMNGDREHRKYLAIWGVGGMLILSCLRNNSYVDVQHVMDHFDSLDDCSAHIHSSCSLTVGRIYFCAPLMLANLDEQSLEMYLFSETYACEFHISPWEEQVLASSVVQEGVETHRAEPTPPTCWLQLEVELLQLDRQAWEKCLMYITEFWGGSLKRIAGNTTVYLEHKKSLEIILSPSVDGINKCSSLQ